MNKLVLADGLSLPLDAVTQTFAILAKRGVGKTYTATVLTEQMLKAGMPVVVLDPIGVWWGLRSSASGKRAGLPITIFGGEHADVPLEATAGETIASLIVDERISAVLDLSKFRKADQNRFVMSFAERLYHRNRKALHLMIDEADAFAPQRPQRGEERMLGALEDIVRRGRARGLGVTLITQRSAVLNKNVLTQAEVLIALRTIAPQDRKAIEAWIEVQGDKEQCRKMMDSLASLKVGEAWFWSPGWLDIFKRVKIARRETFDSSATPKFGIRMKEPKRLAAVDIERIKARISETIERVKLEDPRELRKTILELQKKIKDTPKAAPVNSEIIEKIIYVPMFKKREFNHLKKLLGMILDHAESSAGLTAEIKKHLPEFRRVLLRVPDCATKGLTEKSVMPIPASIPARHEAEKKLGLSTETVSPSDEQEKLLAGERRMIEVLVRLGNFKPSPIQLATLSGLAPDSGTTRNYMGKLRRLKYISLHGDQITLERIPVGISADLPPLQRGDLVAMWKEKLLAGERRMFSFLLSIEGRSISLQELGERVNIVPSSGTFRNYLGKLRRNGLADLENGQLKLSETFLLMAQ